MKLSQKELLDFIYEKEIVKDGNYNFRKMINRQNKQVISDNIDQYVKNYQSNKLVEKLYWLVNDLSDYPKRCLYCHKDITLFGEWKNPYHNIYCSSACSAACEIRKNKVIKTNIERYGSPNAFGSLAIKEKIKNTLLNRYGVDQTFKIPGLVGKIKETNLERYGVECTLQVEEFRNKAKTTNLEKYGVEHAFQSEEVKNKIKETNLERHGVEYISQSKEFKDKLKSSNLKKYGVENVLQREEIKDRIKLTNLEKYGVEHASQSEEVKNKVKETNLERYGVDNVSQLEDTKNKVKANHQLKYYMNMNIRTKNKVTPLFVSDDYNGVSYYYKWKCNTCNDIFEDHLTSSRIPRCLKCYPLTESSGEREVKDFLRGLNINILENDRQIIKPKELDIVISEKNIAIEYCGLYWHGNNSGKPKDYHCDKSKNANKSGYQLITIFEDEWINKREVCEARLKNVLGINDTICYARQTAIKETTNTEYKNFLNDHHIQGFIGAKIKLGAYYNNELVAVITFGKKRRALGNKTQTDDEYELLRFCTKGNIPGMGSKLFKYFTRNYNPEEIVSYCDLRWGTGAFYENLGFELSHISGPNYWYFKYNILRRYHRYQFRKQALTEMASYSFDKTEWQIMQEEGYDKIYDCGNKVFKWVK